MRSSLIIMGMLAGMLASPAQAEEGQVRGVIKAITEATIAVDYSARIAKLPVLEGQAFKTGDVLIAFDCKRFNAEINAARAGARAADLLFSNNRKLAARGAMGANEVEISGAQAAKASAEAQAVQARTGTCSFKAPFDGRMEQRIAQEQETPGPNQPLIKIVDTSRLEIETILPSKWLRWLKPGAAFSFKIDETGEVVTGEIVRMGATVDAVSQTIKAFGKIKTKDDSVLPGMSGTATFGSIGS
jgi:membrane fusion protein (multidrug efflux system)